MLGKKVDFKGECRDGGGFLRKFSLKKFYENDFF